MEDRQNVTITATAHDNYHIYRITAMTSVSPDRIDISPQSLLEIAAYAEANRARLEQEATEDEQRNQARD